MSKPKSPAKTETAASTTPPPEQPRRNFMTEAAAVIIGGLVGIVPLVAGAMTFLDPLRRKSGDGQWIRVATFDSLPDDGVPRFFSVIIDQRDDAWTRYVNEPIGAVFLARNKGEDKITALSATCPHAGCMVAFLTSKGYFQCPCHTSAFKINGERDLEISNVPPRDMDPLEVEVRTTKSGVKEIRVKFQKFKTGIEHREVIA